ncbi:MAG: hypothetical protein RLZZ09_1531 [Pseudomonadota bacterium]|jgi:hypothetical protein
MKPHTKVLIKTLIRVAKGAISALEDWMKEAEKA